MYCSYHKKTPTNLKCGRCDKPICTFCINEVPVGVRCKECLMLSVPEVYKTSRYQTTKIVVFAALAAVFMGFLYTMVLNFVGPLLPIGSLTNLITFGFLLAAGAVVGGVVNFVKGRKIVAIAPTIAGAGVVFALVMGTLFNLLFFGAFPSFFLFFTLFGIVSTLLGLVLGIGIATRISR